MSGIVSIRLAVLSGWGKEMGSTAGVGMVRAQSHAARFRGAPTQLLLILCRPCTCTQFIKPTKHAGIAAA